MRNGFSYLTLIVAIMAPFITQESAYATASTHIWAPSTDTQSFGTTHVTADVYIPTESAGNGIKPDAVTNTGLTVGVLPFKEVTGEMGFDYKTGYGDLDNYPVYFNAKLALPGDTFGALFPAVAFGIYDWGTEENKTDFNVLYVKAAKTLKFRDLVLGRFSVGYFWGNDKLLLDGEANEDADGILAAWERTMTEISEKLWLCVEYQGTNSSYGALNLGFSWQFTPNLAVLAGYQFYNNRDLADTATVQVDINF